MKLSLEYLKLKALRARNIEGTTTKAGDLWQFMIGDAPAIMFVLGHTRGARCGRGHYFVWLYHWGEPCLRVSPGKLRDNDPGHCIAEDWLKDRSEAEYLGNVFDMLPLALLLRTEERPDLKLDEP